MNLSIKNSGYAFLIRFNIFYVIMKGGPIITKFKRLIYQIFN